MFLLEKLIHISLFLYILSIFFALVTYKKQKVANWGSNLLNAAGGLAGGTASLLYLLFHEDRLPFLHIQTSADFIVINGVLDQLSAFFVLILSIVTFSVSLYSIGYLSKYEGERNTAMLNVLMSLFILSLFFVFTAGNSIWFFIAWEVMSVISYFIVVFESEDRENQKAGVLYIIMTQAGTAFLLVNFMIMYRYTGTFSMQASSELIPSSMKSLMFLFFLLGFGTKAGLVPLHIWLPHAHPSAPGNGSAFMSGVMIKTAVYGMIRFVLVFLGVENTWWGITLMVVGTLTIFVGISYAYVEKNIKKLLAYSSIENIGIIFMGMGVSFVGSSLENWTLCGLGLVAALVHTFNHALFKSSLFLGAGSIQYATHTKNMDDLGGLLKTMPLTGVLFLGSSLSIAALIPFNGFIGEWLTYQALFLDMMSGSPANDLVSMLSMAVLAFAGALALATFVKAFGISFLGLPRSEHARHAKEVPATMNVGIGVLVSLCFLLGVFPMALIRLADKIGVSLIGQSSMEEMPSGSMFPTFSVVMEGNRISPLAGLFLILFLASFALMAARFLGGKTKEEKVGTWDCGFKPLNSRMQYTGSGYSKSLNIIFKFLFRPTRSLKRTGVNVYHPETMEYVMTTEPIFEKYLYAPVVRFVRGLSGLAKQKIQTGSIHAYLIYIFITVLLLMLYNRLA